MRILHLCSWFQPKLGYSEFHLPTALQRAGHTVAIVTSDRYYPFPDYDATVRPLLGNRVVGPSCAVENGLQTYRLPVLFECRHHLWLKSLSKVVAEFRPDIVHVYQTFTLPTFQACLMKKKFGYGLIVRSTMEKEVFNDQPFGRRIFYSLFSRFCAPLMRSRIDRFTTISNGGREIVQGVISLPESKVEVVPLGADSHRFQFQPRARSEIRERLGIGAEEFVVIYAGKLIERKDVHVLADAVATLPEKTFLLLVGRGTESYQERLSAPFKGKKNRVFFHEPVPNDQLNNFFSTADVAVWPSESSNAAIEAAMVGIPLVVCDSEGSRSYVAADNGRLFPRGDENALGAILHQFARDPDLRRRLAENGRQHVVNSLSWDAIAARTVNTYESILARPTVRS